MLRTTGGGRRLTFQPGDLLFFRGTGFASRTIEFVTRGPSHVGIITSWRGHGKTVLAESTTLCPHADLELGKKIDGVQIQDPIERISDYFGRVTILRLSPGWELDERERRTLRDMVELFHGEPYDLPGALLSGTRLLKWTSLMPYPSLGNFFCSELCAELLMRVSRLPGAIDPGVFNPTTLFRHALRCACYRKAG